MKRNATGAIGTITGGLVGTTDLSLTAPGSGLSVNVAAGECYVPGSTSFASTPSGYYLRNTATLNLPISTANPSNPRVDLVCATINDATYHGAVNSGVLQVVTGTPSAGANLTNLTGAAALPDASLLIGYVLVPAAASNIITGDIQNTLNYLSVGGNQVNLTYPALTSVGSAIGGGVSLGTNTPTKILDTATLAVGKWRAHFQATLDSLTTGSEGSLALLSDTATCTFEGPIGAAGNFGTATSELHLSIDTHIIVTVAGTVKLMGEQTGGGGGNALAASLTIGTSGVTGYTAERIQ